MPLPETPLASICDKISVHIENLGQEHIPSNWADINILVGAPGINIENTLDKNTLNLFFYRFEPFGFNADAGAADVHWIKVFCIITAIGIDVQSADEIKHNESAGFNELSMLSEVMRLFHEQPVILIDGEKGKVWHTQFIPRPLADEQINQIWSTQGSVVYRPSIAYEITLAPIEPKAPAAQTTRVASIGTTVGSNINYRDSSWSNKQPSFHFPLVPSITVDVSNPQWAPAIVMVTDEGGVRHASLTLSLNIVVANNNTITGFPVIDIWIAGDTDKTVNLVGQLLQGKHWQNIDTITNQEINTLMLDIENLPPKNSTIFTLELAHWTDFSISNKNWQLQLFAERTMTVNNVEVRIRSNPILITITRDES